MAAHDRLLAEEELDYDYEGLPSNFSLAANMTAGAFAGIAVRKLENIYTWGARGLYGDRNIL